MSRSSLGYGLLALLVSGSQAGRISKEDIQWNGNDNGCNGVPHGIPCCQEGFAVGDNGGRKEIFIQADEYISSCVHTCKVLHKDSVGITESVNEQYDSGQGKNQNKCWCEFGEHKLNCKNMEYRTCLFMSVLEEFLPSDVVISSRGHEPPEFLLVTSKGVAAEAQPEKMGLYQKLGNNFHNNFPVWKKENEEECLFMSDHHHWAIARHNNTDLFGILNYEDKPTPALPHLAGDWMFWNGQEWKEDELLKVLEVSVLEESLPSDTVISSRGHEPPEFFLVTSKGVAAAAQSEKMGLYRKLGNTFHNNFPVWKKEKEEECLFMSDHHHWAIGRHNNTDLFVDETYNVRMKGPILDGDVEIIKFGTLNYEVKPTPALPHLAGDWIFWNGQEWREDELLKVLEGDKEDVGIDREIIFLEHSPLIIENVDDASHCCQACKDQADPLRNLHSDWDHTKVFNYNRGAKTCDCMDLLDSHRQPVTAVFTRYNPHFTSGLCDTKAEYELERRTGSSGYGTKRYYNKDTYNYHDVQGPLGEGRMFFHQNLNYRYGHHQTAVVIDGPLDHDTCCRECQKINPKIQLEYHIVGGSNKCHCYEVNTGTRPVTFPTYDKTFAGICNTKCTKNSPNYVELIGGNSSSQGNVYVANSQGKLGAICARPDFSSAAARVVCRQLGFIWDAGIAYEGSNFGPVNDDFAMSEVECIGDEARIQDCQYNSDVVRCTWGDGAGVKCNQK